MKKYVIVTADENDGDYITRKSSITDSQIEGLKPILKAIKTPKGHNWENYETEDLVSKYDGILTEEQIENFNQYVPNNEYGVHTIISVEILEVANEYNLFE